MKGVAVPLSRLSVHRDFYQMVSCFTFHTIATRGFQPRRRLLVSARDGRDLIFWNILKFFRNCRTVDRCFHPGGIKPHFLSLDLHRNHVVCRGINRKQLSHAFNGSRKGFFSRLSFSHPVSSKFMPATRPSCRSSPTKLCLF